MLTLLSLKAFGEFSVWCNCGPGQYTTISKQKKSSKIKSLKKHFVVTILLIIAHIHKAFSIIYEG